MFSESTRCLKHPEKPSNLSLSGAGFSMQESVLSCQWPHLNSFIWIYCPLPTHWLPMPMLNSWTCLWLIAACLGLKRLLQREAKYNGSTEAIRPSCDIAKRKNLSSASGWVHALVAVSPLYLNWVKLLLPRAATFSSCRLNQCFPAATLPTFFSIPTVADTDFSMVFCIVWLRNTGLVINWYKLF